jgi:alkylated DNA nucleotide flippase Atl1
VFIQVLCACRASREGSDWIQRDLLLAEGISVDAAGRLPLARHRWRPQENFDS